MTKKIKSVVLASALLSIFPLVGEATPLININFGSSYSGAAVIGESLDQWNNLSYSSLLSYHLSKGGSGPIALKDVAGIKNIAEISSWSFNGYSTITNTRNAFYRQTGYGLMRQYDYVNPGLNNTGYLSISGLTPGKYKIYIYSQSENNQISPSMNIEANNKIIISSPERANTYSVFEENVNYFVGTFSINPDQDLDLEFINNSSLSKIAINGIQIEQIIEPVPEPASVVLIGVGGFFLFSLKKHIRNKEDTVKS